MSQGSARGTPGPTGAMGPTGPQGVTGATGAPGPVVLANGSATLDFGATPGTNNVSVAVVGQAGILAGSTVHAWFMNEASADHNAYEHMVVGMDVVLTCGTIVPGTGFTIFASTQLRLTGQWKVRWFWN